MPLLAAPPKARSGAPDWEKDSHDWPNREHSSFHAVGDRIWHVQRRGDGPVALLLHGTGAGTHSWAEIFPLIAQDYDTIAIDLPGHGFTQSRRHHRPTLPAMVRDVDDLLRDLDVHPELMIGHSAGAAIMVSLAQMRAISTGHIVSINGALKPFPGFAHAIASTTAQMLTFGGVAANMFAQGARDRRRVERLLVGTGGKPPEASVDLYARLLRHPAHVSGTLQMMANWDLSDMPRILPELEIPILFLAGSQDETVSPDEAARLAHLVQRGEHVLLPGLGHLAHEEAPGTVLKAMTDWISQTDYRGAEA